MSTMVDWTTTMRRAREQALVGSGGPAGPVSPVVLESWHRSIAYGLDPDAVTPEYMGDGDDGPARLIEVVEAVVAERRTVLDQTMSGLSLTDQDGRLLRQWVGDRELARRFEAAHILPGFSVAESKVGTSSGICLLTGEPTIVRGPEHFSEQFQHFTCAGSPIIHPVTRRTVGSLDLTCRYEDTSPVMLLWVMELVAEVQRGLHGTASRRERLLLDAYLAEHRDARHAVVALNDQTIITNAAAARLLGSVDQALLWEHASRHLDRPGAAPSRVVLSDGRALAVTCQRVADGVAAAGAVLTLQPDPVRAGSSSSRPRTADLGGLAGCGERWTSMSRRLAAAGSRDLLLRGEAGTGKAAIAVALLGAAPVTVIDAGEAALIGAAAWLSRLDGLLATGGALVVRHADLLDPALSRAALDRIDAGPRGRLVATADTAAGPAAAQPLVDHFGVVVEVPALRDRTEDLPALLASLSATERTRAGEPERPAHWMPDAVQALSRLPWPGNVAGLATVVREVLGRNRTGYLCAADLPAEVVASASRRRLSGLEEVEARAITAALGDAGGNKQRAAESLGIARSTLYRKIRALGIDLSALAY